MKNGCPNCRSKSGKGKFVPPGHADEVLAARAPTEAGPVALPTEVPDFSEHAEMIFTKRRPVPTSFYQPEQKKSSKRFACCVMCSGNTSVRFCDASMTGFACQNCREHDYVCMYKDEVLVNPPSTIGKQKYSL